MRHTTNLRPPQRHKGLGSEAGQSTAEFGIVLMVLLMIILGIFDLGRAVFAQNVLAIAAREGARYASTHPTDTANIELAAKAVVAGIDPDEVSVTLTQPDSTHVQVEVTYRYRAMVQLIGQFVDGGSGTGITLRGRSQMRTE